MYKNIPKELKEMKRWVNWKFEDRNGKTTKTPVNAKTGGYAQSNNSDTWSSYNLAESRSGEFDGIGFMLGNGVFGIDIDDKDEDIKLYKNGDNDNVISEFIHSLESYAEYSPSGNGIHVLCKGELPEGGRRKGQFEFYEKGRFFTVTGNIASEYKDLKDSTESVKYLHSKYIGTNETINHSNNKTTKSLDLNEQQIVDIALKSKQGQAFNTLYSGFWEGLYPSQSEADLSFANMLAFWCDRDYAKMDSIFRKSGLYRPKWDSKRGASTYGEGILNKAIADCSKVFTPGTGIEDYGITILDNKVKRYCFDDTGNADRFVEKFHNVARFSYVDKGWYSYNGKKWEFDNYGNIKSLTEEILKEMRLGRALCADEDEEKAFDKHLKYTRNNKGKVNMIKESEHRLPILPSEFDTDTTVFNVFNGVIDLKNSKLHEHDFKRFISKISHVEYTDKVDCPQWREFLNQIFDEDQELIDYIQKSVGYSMTGSTKEQCVFFCYGNGRNGKSTFLDIVTEIMGDYAINIQPETIMVKQGQGQANSDIARLKGSRFVTTVEPNEGARINEGLLKQLTGGDKVTARKLYGNEFEFEPEFKLWMATNHKPIIRGRDLGIWRRMHMVPFTVQIEEDQVDKNLKYKLRKELTGIMKWAVDGCLKWQREGLEMPSKVQEAVKEYRSEMDVISAFLEVCVETGHGETKSSELYKVYAAWANENNEYKMSNTKFGTEMQLRFERVKKKDGNYYQDISLISDYNIDFLDK